MTKLIFIKKATESDIEEWVDARIELWPSHSRKEHLEEISEFFQGDGYINFIGRIDNKLCCFLEASIRPFANGCSQRPVPFLEGIWVDPKYQRSGFGQQLVKKLEEWAIANGFNEIGSDCEIENAQSQNAHEKWGFQEKERVVYYHKSLCVKDNEIEIPTLETKRLRLEPLSMKHSLGMFKLWSDEKVSRYSGPIRDSDGNLIDMPASRIEQTDLLIEFWDKALNDGWGFRWAIILLETDDPFLGTVGFNSLSDQYEIAFHLVSDYWGKGIMTEASTAAIIWAFSRGATSIEAFIEPENKPSFALATRLGMHPTEDYIEGARKYVKVL